MYTSIWVEAFNLLHSFQFLLSILQRLGAGAQCEQREKNLSLIKFCYHSTPCWECTGQGSPRSSRGTNPSPGVGLRRPPGPAEAAWEQSCLALPPHSQAEAEVGSKPPLATLKRLTLKCGVEPKASALRGSLELRRTASLWPEPVFRFPVTV